jgi:hypothetical protein
VNTTEYLPCACAPRLVHIGLRELLVFTLREYEDLAVALLTNPSRLARVREARPTSRGHTVGFVCLRSAQSPIAYIASALRCML